MALFFYRAWAGVTASKRLQLTPADPIYYTRQQDNLFFIICKTERRQLNESNAINIVDVNLVK
jgi:hypothetical protein